MGRIEGRREGHEGGRGTVERKEREKGGRNRRREELDRSRESGSRGEERGTEGRERDRRRKGEINRGREWEGEK